MPSHILGRRVDNHVGSPRQRLLEERGGEGVVDHEERPRRVGGLSQCPDIRDGQQRVRGGLHPDRIDWPCRERLGHRIQVGHIDDPILHAPRSEDLVDEPESSAVRVVPDENTPAR